MVQSFLELPEVDQYKKMTNQESFLQARAKKMTDQYHRSGRNIHDLELCMLLYDYMGSREMDELNQHDAASVFYYADSREKMISHMLHTAMAKEESSGNASNALMEHPKFQHNNVLPNVDTTSNVALTSCVATTTQASSMALGVQMMFPWNFGGNQPMEKNSFKESRSNVTGPQYRIKQKSMARKKVKVAYILNGSLRRSTFRKRRSGLIKKVGEIGTLCDVKACAVIYGPDVPGVEVWPSVPEAQRMVQSFIQLPEIEQGRKMTSQESFLEEQAKRMNDRFNKSEQKILDHEIGMMLYEYMMCGRDLNQLNHANAASMYYFADKREKMILEMIEAAKAVNGTTTDEVAPLASSSLQPNIPSATTAFSDHAATSSSQVAPTAINNELHTMSNRQTSDIENVNQSLDSLFN